MCHNHTWIGHTVSLGAILPHRVSVFVFVDRRRNTVSSDLVYVMILGIQNGCRLHYATSILAGD